MQKTTIKRIQQLIYVSVLVFFFLGSMAFADGDENTGLGGVSSGFQYQSGTGMIAEGVGLAGSQTGIITVDVPLNATVRQAILYWNGYVSMDNPDALNVLGATQSITVNGMSCPGMRISGSTATPVKIDGMKNAYTSTYRKDLAECGIQLNPGQNSLAIQSFEAYDTLNGAGVFVVFDDHSQAANTQIKDGQDFAFFPLDYPLDSTKPITFTFAASSSSRTLNLDMLFAGVASPGSSGGNLRPTLINVMVGSNVLSPLASLLNSSDGSNWDSLTTQITIPAGVTSITVSAQSSGSGGVPASFVWIASGISFSVQAGQTSGQTGPTGQSGIQEPLYMDSKDASVNPDTKYSFVLSCVSGQPNQFFYIELRKLGLKFNTDLRIAGALPQNTCYLDPTVVPDDPRLPFNRIAGATLGTMDKMQGVFKAEYEFRDGRSKGGLANRDAGYWKITVYNPGGANHGQVIAESDPLNHRMLPLKSGKQKGHFGTP